MDLRFIKLRVAGSDLLLVEGVDGVGTDDRGVDVHSGPGGDLASLARSVLHRRRGVGALRFVTVARSEKDFRLDVYDREGENRVARFDAALCAARWLLDSGGAGGESLRFKSGEEDILVDILDGSFLGVSAGPLLGLPDRRPLDAELALERRMRIEAKGEAFDALPVALGARGAGIEGVVFFHEGGAGPLKVRLGSRRRNAIPPVAIPTRSVSEGEIGIGTPRDARVDSVSMAAMALGAANLLGRSGDDALVRSGDGALWARRNGAGSLYVAARPAYVFRGEFHIEDADSAVWRNDRSP